jgi:hypothetical protein
MNETTEAGFEASEILGLPSSSKMKVMLDVLVGAGATNWVVLILLSLLGVSQPFES